MKNITSQFIRPFFMYSYDTVYFARWLWSNMCSDYKLPLRYPYWTYAVLTLMYVGCDRSWKCRWRAACYNVLTSVSLSLELLLMEGLDSSLTLSLSLSLQLFCPGFSYKHTKSKGLMHSTTVLTAQFGNVHGQASHRNWFMNMWELAGAAVLSV